MDRQWHIRQQLELLSSPTSIQYHRIECYSSIVEGVRRVRRILAGDSYPENDRLIHACCRNDLDGVQWLLENTELDVIDLKSGINRSALHEAVLHRKGQVLARLLCQYGADPKQRDSLGRTPIHYAASCGHLDIMMELIYFSRASVSALVDMEGRCPLMYACGEGHLSVCQWLVEHGNADYQRCDDRGRSCLVYACRSGHVQVVEWLLTLLSPQATSTGWHPLHYACSAGHFDITRLLLVSDSQHGQVITKTGHSALFMAMHSPTNSLEMVKYLLDWHPSIHLTAQDIDDFTCDKSFVLLLAQRRHSLTYLVDLLERITCSPALVHLLLLSEHSYSWKQLKPLLSDQRLMEHYARNPLTLKQITRCFIRKSTHTSQQIDLLVRNENLRKFLRFEYLI